MKQATKIKPGLYKYRGRRIACVNMKWQVADPRLHGEEFNSLQSAQYALDALGHYQFVGRSRSTGEGGPRERQVRTPNGRTVWVEEGSAVWDLAEGQSA